MLKLYSFEKLAYIISKANTPITPPQKVKIITLYSKDFINLLTINVSGKNEIGYNIKAKEPIKNK